MNASDDTDPDFADEWSTSFSKMKVDLESVFTNVSFIACVKVTAFSKAKMRGKMDLLHAYKGCSPERVFTVVGRFIDEQPCQWRTGEVAIMAARIIEGELIVSGPCSRLPIVRNGDRLMVLFVTEFELSVSSNMPLYQIGDQRFAFFEDFEKYLIGVLGSCGVIAEPFDGLNKVLRLSS